MPEYIINRGGPRDKLHLPLATKDGTEIPNERRREWAPDAQRSAKKDFAEQHPKARLRSASATYNCVGLVFANRRTWIDTEHLLLIYKGDRLRKVIQVDRVNPGDLLIYKDRHGEIQHIGVVLNTEPSIERACWNITVLSKWGPMGEYIHGADDVPIILGTPSEYWTERK